jgi:hypothetical protein
VLFTGVLAGIGPAGLVTIAILGIITLATLFSTNWAATWESFKRGATEAYYALLIVALLAAEVLKQIGLINENPFAKAAGAPSSNAPTGPTGSTQEDVNKRVETENPKVFARATGGWVPGSGGGDRVPAMLEGGEYVVQRSVAQRLGGFLEALNAGMVRGFSMGGIVESMNSVAPARAGIGGEGGLPAARPAQDTAMFHLTIEGKTFSGLSAPRQTADEMVQHARTSSIVRAGPKPSWYGRG